MPLSAFQLLTFQSIKGLGHTALHKLYEESCYMSESVGNSVVELTDFLNEKFKKVDPKDVSVACNAAQTTLESVEKEGIFCLCPHDEMFPNNLKHLVDTKFDKQTSFRSLDKLSNHNEGPLILFVKCNQQALSNLNHTASIAMIGARDCGEDAIKAGKIVGQFFADKGFNIVSGLADGCDKSAHEGSLQAKQGFTTAIMAQGLDFDNRSWSKEKMILAESILEHNGILMSEYPPGTVADRFRFIKRDRLQSGLSTATMIIAMKDQNCGTLKTLQCAAINNKPIFAIKYKQFSEYSSGNKLLLSGDPVINDIYHCRPVMFDQLENISQEILATFNDNTKQPQKSMFGGSLLDQLQSE